MAIHALLINARYASLYLVFLAISLALNFILVQ